MDEDLIDDALPIARKSRLPGTGFFYPDSLDEAHADQRVAAATEDASAVVIADTDADGLACVALVRAVRNAALSATDFEAAIERRLGDDRPTDEGERPPPDDAADGPADASSTVALVGASPHSFDRALARVAKHLPPGADVFVCDLCPDERDAIDDPIATLSADGGSLRWFDHHQWDERIEKRVRASGVDLVLGDSDEECTTDVALRALDHDFPDHLRDLAAVTRDHDLWIKEDPRSDDLADYAQWADPEEYVAVVGEHGPDLPSSVRSFLDSRREEKAALIARAVDRATTHEVGPWTIATTYGRCSQNEVADELRDKGADAVVVVKPAGSASLRGSESFERCHEVAGLLGGGGHPKAAGCKPDIYDDMLDYAEHWLADGRAARRVILAAFERIAAEEKADGVASKPDE